MLKILFLLTSIVSVTSNQCSCLLGYRNGAQAGDANLCMGPSEGGKRPCYPTPCNADWTACTTQSENDDLWEKDTSHIGKRPDCPFSKGAIAIATAALRRLLSFWIRVGCLSRLEVIRLRKSSENDKSPMLLFSVLPGMMFNVTFLCTTC